MNEVQATLCGAVFGGIIGVVGTYVGAVRIAQRQRFIDASHRLREAFHDELAALLADFDIDAIRLLESAFKKHLVAITEFSYALSKNKRREFNQAWQQYHCAPEVSPCYHFLEQYATKHGNTSELKKNKQLAIDRIQVILSFTE